MTIEPLDASFGASVTGVRLADLDDDRWRRIHDAWLEYGLLIFPDQHLTADQQIGFARRFGDIEVIGGGEIVPLSNVKSDGSLRGDDDVVKILKGNMSWHADSTYMPVQAKGAVFSAEVVPSGGGETGWADMHAAYEALEPELRELVDGLSAHHSLHYSQSKLGHSHSDDSDYVGYGMEHDGTPLRPLVKVHPETGRRSLNIGRHAHAVPGMDLAESEQLLTELVEFACRPPRVHHHRWTAGDAVVWDNRRLLHRARPWDLREPRVMWHSRIAGDPLTEKAPLSPSA